MFRRKGIEGALLGFAGAVILAGTGLLRTADVLAQPARGEPAEPDRPPVSRDPAQRFTTPDILPEPAYRKVLLDEPFLWKAGAARQPEIIQFPGAKWIQVHFDELTHLGEHSSVTVTSLEDEHSQTLNAITLNQGRGSSLLFNGDAVRLKVNLASTDQGVLILIREVTIGIALAEAAHGAAPSDDAQCNNGNLQASADRAVGRIMNYPCTGWIVSNGAILSAGHCHDIDNPEKFGILQFEVPQSTADGSIINPAPSDQYYINPDTIKSDNDEDTLGRGEDWAVFAVYPNSETGLMPAQRQQAFYRLTVEASPSQIGLVGYGFNDDPKTDNHTRQRPSGGSFLAETEDGIADVYLTLQIHASKGMSGAPVIDVDRSAAIGIFTNACSGDKPAAGTSFSNQALQEALTAFAGPNTVFVDSGHPATEEDGSVFRPYKSLDAGLNALPAGGILSVVKGTYELAPGTIIDTSVTISTPVGPLIIE